MKRGSLAADAKERAYQLAMLFLSYRARSDSNMRRDLRKHEIPEAVIDETIERLHQDRLVNDQKFECLSGKSQYLPPRSRRMMHR